MIERRGRHIRDRGQERLRRREERLPGARSARGLGRADAGHDERDEEEPLADRHGPPEGILRERERPRRITGLERHLGQAPQ